MRHLANLALLALLAGVLYLRAPLWWENFQTEGKPAPAARVKLLGAGELSLPAPGEPRLLVFWATWCGPCRIELARLQRMVAGGTLAAGRVVAISRGESEAVVAAHVKSQGYKFLVATDEGESASRAYGVSVTPTLVLIGADGKVKWKTAGLSPSLELRLRSALN